METGHVPAYVYSSAGIRLAPVSVIVPVPKKDVISVMPEVAEIFQT